MRELSARGSSAGRRSVLVALGLAGALVATTLVSASLPSSVAEAAPATNVELPPTRLIDTRPNATPPGVIAVPKVKLTPNVALAVTMAGAGGLPVSGAAAFNLNVTATEAAGAGNLAVYPCAEGYQGTSNLNFQAATATSRSSAAVSVTAAPDAAGKVCFRSNQPVHIVVDTFGWLPAGGGYDGVGPFRLFDTRGNPGAVSVPVGRLSPLVELGVKVTGVGGVPASGVEAVLVNLVATAGANPGFLAAYSCAGGYDGTSNVNFQATQSRANAAVVPVGADGRICFLANQPVHVVVDVIGTFAEGSGFTAAGPTRMFDTRDGEGGVPVGKIRLPNVLEFDPFAAGLGLPSSGVTALSLNVVGTRGVAPGFLSVYPCADGSGGSSTLNYGIGQSVANSIFVPVDSAGKVCFASNQFVDVVVDLTGWFTEPMTPSDVTLGATVKVTPNGGLNASTFTPGSISIENTSQNSAGPAPQLTSLEFDLSTSLLPDVVFDPAGTGGDATAKCLEVGPTAAAVGYVTPADPCVDPFGQPLDGGFQTMSLAFDDFDSGEQLVAAVDIDPTSIKGASGFGDAGSISGLEMSGAIVTATFEGGLTLIGTLFGDGSKGGGQVALVSAPATAPTIGVQGSTATALPSLSPVHDKVDVATATVDLELTGTPTAVVRLMNGPAVMQNGVFDVQPFEANTLTDATFTEVTLSGSGTAVTSVPVAEGLNYLIAVEGSEIPSSGLASRVLIIDRDGPSLSGVLYRVNSGGPAVAAGDGGVAWTADTVGNPSPYWLTGSPNTFTSTDPVDLSDASIPPAAVEALFQTYRFDVAGGDDMSYGFPVGSGQSYEVDLYLAETFLATNGARVFDISVEGVLINDLDIHAIVGADAGYVITVETPVIADDELTIEFGRQVENPKINAIEVRNPAGAATPPSLAPIADVTIFEGGTTTIPLTLVETGGDPVTLSISQTPSTPSVVTLDAPATELVVAAPAGSAGTYTVNVTATDVDGSTVQSFAIDVLPTPVPGSIIHRINAGGPTIAAIDSGPDWSADTLNSTWYGSGTAVATFVFAGRDGSVPVSALQPLFHTQRFGDDGPMSWDIPVPAGEPIEVRLYFGDGFTGTSDPGERLFTAAIDGINAFGTIDLAVDPGFGIGTMKSFSLISDGNLDLDFTASVQNPLVNAIEILSAEP